MKEKPESLAIIDELDTIWKESPAYIIDWIRDNKTAIREYLFKLNKDIDEFIKNIS